VNQEFIRLVQLLQGQVELLYHRGSVVTRELLIGLTDNVVNNIVGTLNRYLEKQDYNHRPRVEKNRKHNKNYIGIIFLSI